MSPNVYLYKLWNYVMLEHRSSMDMFCFEKSSLEVSSRRLESKFYSSWLEIGWIPPFMIHDIIVFSYPDILIIMDTLLTSNLMQIWMRWWTPWWRDWSTPPGAASTVPKLWPTLPWWGGTVRSTWTAATHAIFVAKKLKPEMRWKFTKEDITEMVLA